MIEQWVGYEAFDDGPPPGRGLSVLLLRCNPAMPLAVQMVFDTDLVLDIGRNLLCQGVQYPAGLGDCRIEPYTARIAVTLSSHTGRSLLLLDRPPVDVFVHKIRDIDDDTPDIDQLLAQIFKGEQR